MADVRENGSLEPVQSFATIVIFGATGDLAQRMLFPSLYNLDADGLLAAAVRIHGAARSKLDDPKVAASA